MNKFFSNYSSRLLFLTTDLLSIAISLFFSILLRYDFQFPIELKSYFFSTFSVAIVIKLSSFLAFGMYKGLWRYTSISDLVNIIKASSLGTLLYISFLALSGQLTIIPNSILLIDYVICTILLSSTRASVRLFYSNYSKSFISDSLKIYKKRILIIGAGSSSQKIIREIRDDYNIRYVVAGIIDDDPTKIGATIHGVPIFGPIEKLSMFKIAYDEIIICIPSATSEQMRRIISICKSSEKPYRTLPTFSELIDDKVSINTVREVSIVDLLGRKEIQLDRSSISQYLSGKKVLVTGAGGSIGSELVRQCLTFDPDLLILLDQSEHNLFKIEKECSTSEYPISYKTVLGDIRDKGLLKRLFSNFSPDVVFHAAAYKHVPMQEHHPWEAVLTNIKGTVNLVEVAEEFKVNRFVLVSTDKAVNPSNIMGATKRIAEILIQTKSKSSRVNFITVRFGNVIGSSGSVIPTFQNQIRSGGPLTITNSKMQRFFMSISEAAQLILQSGSMGKGGEIFVLDMGEPVNIKDIAYELIRLSGLEPEKDISIEYIGSRPGEKLKEELKATNESISRTNHNKILVLKNSRGVNWDDYIITVNKLIQSAKSYDINIITNEILKCVPEYKPNINNNYNDFADSILSEI